MTSQLNVDTIVDKAGSGGSNVKMANTSTYVSDGSAVSQNTVQSLTKTWVNFEGDASGSPIRDSFNVSSTDDDGVGDYGVNFSSSMSNNDYSMTGSACLSAFDNNDVGLIGPSRTNAAASLATGSVQLDGQKSSNTDGAARDVNVACIAIHGDLA